MNGGYIPQSLSSRRLIFAPEDESAYCDLLRSYHPEVRFALQLDNFQTTDPAPPPNVAYDHVAKCPPGWLDFYFTFPAWKLEYTFQKGHYRHYWSAWEKSLTWPNGYWQRTIVQQDWIEYKTGERIRPQIGVGEIVFRARTDRPEERKLVARLLRQVSKVATNRYQIVFPNEPRRPPNVFDKHGAYWIGHHALEWVRQHPDRVLSQGPAHLGGYLVMPLD